MTTRRIPVGVHLLTGIHGLGSIACFVLSVGSGLSDGFRNGLTATEGGQLMVSYFGEFTWLFLAIVAAILACLAFGSWKLRPFVWPLTLAVYSIAVAGSLWKVSLGIDGALVGVVTNACVVLYAARPTVRAAYGFPGPPPLQRRLLGHVRRLIRFLVPALILGCTGADPSLTMVPTSPGSGMETVDDRHGLPGDRETHDWWRDLISRSGECWCL